MLRQGMAAPKAFLSRQKWTRQRCSVAHDRAELAKASVHIISDDKLWKCRNMDFLVAIGLRVLCRDSGFVLR